MSDVILAIAIFHSLCALTLITCFAIGDCRSLLRRRKSSRSILSADQAETAGATRITAEHVGAGRAPTPTRIAAT